jgi:hypothetical protein
MPLSKNDKNSLLIILVIVIFISLLVIWRISLYGLTFQQKAQIDKTLFSQVIDQGNQLKKDTEKKLLEFINQSSISQEQATSTPSTVQLTNQEVKKIEEKILEHLNQTNQENNP